MSEWSTDLARTEHGWTRRRVIFLSISGTLAVVLLWATREVLLPFILALIIAYVLTPLVAGLERLRVPRVVAILSVYALVFGTLYGAGAVLAPRLYDETSTFLKEAPVMADKLADQWGPRFDGWVKGLRKRGGGSEQMEGASEHHPISPIEIRERAEGGYHVEIGTGLEFVQVATDRWQLVPIEPPSELGGDGLVADVIDTSLRYIGRNTMQLVPRQLIPLPWIPASLATPDFIGLIGKGCANASIDRALGQTVAPTLRAVAAKTWGPLHRLVPDITRSDHFPFWNANIPALLWTDTANFRNPHYHRPTDTPDTLDYLFMREVAALLCATVTEEAQR